jgi:phytoene synthase
VTTAHDPSAGALEPPPGPALDAAYAACARITSSQARNFAYGIRLLPPARRAAMCAVYALARRVDDIGDGDLPLPAKREALAAVRASLTGPAAADDPVVTAVHDVAERFPLPLEAFEDLVDGVETDVEMDAGLHRCTTVADQLTYCRRVAGSIGRLSLGVFGSRPDPRAAGYADALGVGLQLTNILRDVREDLAAGPGTPRAGASCRSWTTAAPPAPPRWPASTGACSTGSPPSRS